MILKPAILGENHVSSRAVPNGRRPIIDLANQSLLSGLADYSEVKILASFERIQVAPSHRAFAIQRSRNLSPPFRVLEVFAGGGTMTAALTDNPNFQVVAGVEIEPDFADEWQAQHPEAMLVQFDFRALRPSELPAFEVLLGDIPNLLRWRRWAVIIRRCIARAPNGLSSKCPLWKNTNCRARRKRALHFHSTRMPLRPRSRL